MVLGDCVINALPRFDAYGFFLWHLRIPVSIYSIITEYTVLTIPHIDTYFYVYGHYVPSYLYIFPVLDANAAFVVVCYIISTDTDVVAHYQNSGAQEGMSYCKIAYGNIRTHHRHQVFCMGGFLTVNYGICPILAYQVQ